MGGTHVSKTSRGAFAPGGRALAARRGLIAAAALVASIVAHAVATGGLAILPMAPAAWGIIIAGAMVLGPRAATFRPRAPSTTLLLIIGAQAAVHAAMTVAPWAFGLDVHHVTAFLTPVAVLVHLAAAVLLALVVARVERVLASLIRVARTVCATVVPRASGTPPLLVLFAPVQVRVVARGLRRALPRRGPPLAA